MEKLSVSAARQETAIGKSARLEGWVRTRRDSKAGFSFIEINDGSSQGNIQIIADKALANYCLLYTSPSPRDRQKSRMPSSA